jgi:hypothetical protein
MARFSQLRSPRVRSVDAVRTNQKADTASSHSATKIAIWAHAF